MNTRVIASSGSGLVEAAFSAAFPEELSKGLISYSVSRDTLSAFPAVIAPFGYELASPQRFPTDLHLSSAFSDREVRRLFKVYGPYAERECDTVYVGLNLLARFELEGKEIYPKTGPEMVGFLSGRIGGSCDYALFLTVGNPYCVGSYPLSAYAFGTAVGIVGPGTSRSDGEGPVGEFFRYTEPEIGAEVGGHLEEFFIRTRRKYYRPFGFN